MDRGRRFRPVFELLEERRLLKGPDEAPSLGPPPAEGPGVIHVDSVAELQGALDNDIQSNTTIVIQPGVYNLTSTLFLNPNTARSHITIRGETDDFDDVVIRGQGMDDADIPHGIWIGNLQDVTIANLTIGEVYFHPIQIHGELGADDVHLYHVRLYDGGEQFVKSADGADNCSVKYSVFEYTNGPPTIDHGGGTGYTNAIDVLDGDNWVIQHNLIRNFHTPDNADNLWNPAILMWSGSQQHAGRRQHVHRHRPRHRLRPGRHHPGRPLRRHHPQQLRLPAARPLQRRPGQRRRRADHRLGLPRHPGPSQHHHHQWQSLRGHRVPLRHYRRRRPQQPGRPGYPVPQ